MPRSIARAATWFLSAALLAPIILASPADAARRTVKGGQEAFLMAYYRYKLWDCSSQKPTVRVVRAPANGTLVQKSGSRDPYNSSATDDWSARCTGKRIRSLEFFYRPNKGFRGTDRVSLRMLGGDNDTTEHFDIVVE